MTFENRKRLAKHFYSVGQKKHPYVLEMKKTKCDNQETVEIEEHVGEIQEDSEIVTSEEVQE